jgi:hypothetical protein
MRNARKPQDPNALDASGESAELAAADDLLLQHGDFYMEGPYVVFTAAYHLRRGFCCNSECRHCPYK